MTEDLAAALQRAIKFFEPTPEELGLPDDTWKLYAIEQAAHASSAAMRRYWRDRAVPVEEKRQNAKASLILPELIDSFCELKKAREDFAATESLYQKAYAQLKASLVDAPADQTYVVSGKEWTLEISERRMEGKLDAKAVRKRLGADIFLKVVTITAKALESYLLKPEIEAMTIREQTGARTFVASPK